jgi:GNAT superfamily N-acetyltransferase
MMLNDIEIKEGLEGLTPARIATLYRRAPLLRPVEDHEKIWSMFEQSSVVITAWQHGRLVGLARILTDGVLNSMICDFAVEPDVQGSGVGRMILDAINGKCKGTTIYLYDRKATARFYAKMGFQKQEGIWIYKG